MALAVAHWNEAPDMRQLGDENLAAYLRFATVAKGGTVLELDGTLAFAAPLPIQHPMVNGCLAAGEPAGPEVLERARGFFAARNRPFFLWARDEDTTLIEAVSGSEPAMLPALYADRLPSRRPAPVRRITGAGEAAEYLGVLEDAWNYGHLGLGDMIFLPPSAFLSDQVIAVAAYDNDRIVAGAMAFSTGDVAGLYWAASRHAARGLGLGTACLIEAAHLAARHGARTFVLQASRQGLPLWERLGFRQTQTYRRYAMPAR